MTLLLFKVSTLRGIVRDLNKVWLFCYMSAKIFLFKKWGDSKIYEQTIIRNISTQTE